MFFRMSAVFKSAFLLLLISLFVTGCASNKNAPVPKAQERGGYILDAGDELRIIVYGQEELSGEFTIDPTGRISMPLIKDIVAAGKSVRELEEAITAELQPRYLKDPRVSIEVIEYRSVYILGEVRVPGQYPYVPNMTVLQAVAVAGGHTYRSNEKSAEVTRLEGNVLRTFTARNTAMVKPGDTIIVKRRWF